MYFETVSYMKNVISVVVIGIKDLMHRGHLIKKYQ